MKTLFRYSIVLFATLLITISCRDEDLVRFPDVKSGVNARVFLYPDRSFLNFANLSTASIAWDVYSVNTDLVEIVYTAQFTDADRPDLTFPAINAVTVPASAFVNGKATGIEITASQLATALGLSGGTAYYEGGDQFTFKANAKLADGRIVSGENSAPSITGGTSASFTAQFTVFVGCPSNIPDGVYVGTQTDADGWFGGVSTKEVTVTKVAGHPFNYTISDVSAGGYELCCLGFGYNANQPALVSDICGQILVSGGAGSQIKSAQGVSPGSWNATTQTLTVHYDDAFNGSVAGGVDLVSVFVKKP